MFQKRMHRSAVPPPDASRPCWCGDHAMAFTAAVWSENFSTGLGDCWVQMYSWLSFPPEAICRSSGDHFSPHTCIAPATPLYLTNTSPRPACSCIKTPSARILSQQLQQTRPRLPAELRLVSWVPGQQGSLQPQAPLLQLLRLCRGRHELGSKTEQAAHLGSVAPEGVLEVFGGADVPLQDGAVPRAGAQHVAAPGHGAHAHLVPLQDAHPACMSPQASALPALQGARRILKALSHLPLQSSDALSMQRLVFEAVPGEGGEFGLCRSSGRET